MSVVDVCVHPDWTSPEELLPYLPAGWRDYVAANVEPSWREHLRGQGERPATPLVYGPAMPRATWTHPDGAKLATAEPRSRETLGCDPATLRRDHLDAHGVERALLLPSYGMLLPSLPQPQLALELARAANRWLAERWLDDDDRFRGAIIVPTQLAEQAAQEIRRASEHPRMTAVVLATNGLGRPFGHPLYEPIYEAAAERGLTVVIHAGGEGSPESAPYANAGGPASTFGEHYSVVAQTQMTHIASLIVQGVPARHPELRFLMLGAGAAWAVPFLWRFDTEHQGMRLDAPWTVRSPSEYFREAFRIGTYPLDPAPSNQRLISYLGAFRGIEEILCFASGYPNWDAREPGVVSSIMPEAWRERVMRTNALEVLR
jgi:uncharacterized protein